MHKFYAYIMYIYVYICMYVCTHTHTFYHAYMPKIYFIIIIMRVLEIYTLK